VGLPLPKFLHTLIGLSERTTAPATEAPWPYLRNVLLMFFERQRPHAIRAMVEVDVTDSLARIRAIERELRIALPFHAFAVFCVSRAVDEHRTFNTYRRGDALVTFDDIDILSPLDKRLPQGVRIPVGHIVRGAQKKSLAAINWELRKAIRADDIPDDPAVKLRRKIAAAPWWARKLMGRWIVADPQRLRQGHGTVLVSTVQDRGFHRPYSIIAGTVHTLTVFAGSFVDRLALDGGGKVENRRFVCLSGAFDHDIVDGMAIAGFAKRIVQLLESAAGLDQDFIDETRRLMTEDRK